MKSTRLLVYSIAFALVLSSISSLSWNSDMGILQKAEASQSTIATNPITSYYSDHELIQYQNGTNVFVGGISSVLNSTGQYAPYAETDNGTGYIVDTGNGKFFFNKNTCMMAMYPKDADLANTSPVIWNDNYTAWGEQNGASTWNEVNVVDQASCTPTFTAVNTTSFQVDLTKSVAGKGTLDVRYTKTLGHMLKSTVIATNLNPAWTDNFLGIEQKISIPSNVTLGNTTYNLANYNNTSLDRNWISSHQATLINLKNSANLNVLQAYNNLAKIIIHYKHNIATLELDYTFTSQIIAPNTSFTIDPTYGYADTTGLFLYTPSATGTSCPTGTISESNFFSGSVDLESSSSNSYCGRTAFFWTISSIPSGAAISSASVSFGGNEMNSGSGSCDINSMVGDTSGESYNTMYGDIGSGTTYISQTNVCSSSSFVGVANQTLPSQALTDISTDLSNSKPFAVGVKFHSETRASSQYRSMICYSTTGSGCSISYDGDMALQITYTLVPGQVGAPTVTANAGSTETVSWTAPSAGGASIDKYEADYSTNVGSTWTVYNNTLSSSSTSLTSTALTGGSTYEWRIEAHNSYGWSSNGVASSGVIAGDVPSSVRSLVPTSSNAQVGMSWTAPSSNGGYAILNYTVQYGTNNSTWTTLGGTGNTTSSTITGLINGITYDLRIAAVNGIGQGPYSYTTSTTPSAATTNQTIGSEGYHESGRWYSSNTYSAIAPTTQEASANVLRAFPLIIGENFTADRIQFEVTNALPSANCSVGIYKSSSNLYPTTLIVDGGQQSVASVGLKTTTINSTLSANKLYWLAYNCNNSPTLSAIPASGIPDVLGYSGTSGLGTQGTGWTVPKTYNGTLPSVYPVNGTILSNENGMLIEVRAK